jgi:hypothetical protein
VSVWPLLNAFLDIALDCAREQGLDLPAIGSRR